MKINNRIELKNFATDHSADVDYQDFKKIYRKCTKEPYNVWTIDTALPASDYNYDNNKCAFYKFYRDFQNFKDRPLESKYNNISNFYRVLNEFKNHKTNTDETQQRTNRVINNAVALYNNYFDSYKKNFQ